LNQDFKLNQDPYGLQSKRAVKNREILDKQRAPLTIVKQKDIFNPGRVKDQEDFI